ncbi:protein STRUBBELIG-RECEPTOR FAMILY 5-like isoform X2 [Cornus florida]|nr:protein STRUBBELIG-RECEPTOR FAMILY 5-like isoform X2 [Cornus florida]
MGYQLANLKSVSYFDLSKNKLKGDIPYQLPPNASHIDLSGNGFTGGMPFSISLMKGLKYLNLGHNQINGQMSDVFGQLSKLSELDLSFNSLSGDLPQSFKNLSSLTSLHLQNNKFTGSINALASLPLDDLNVANNKFTGWVPDGLKDIKKLETGGNSWSSGPAPPSPPGHKSKSRANKQSEEDGEKKSGLSTAAIVGIVLAVLLAVIILIALFSRKSSPPSHFLDEERLSQRKPFTSLSFDDLSDDKRNEMHRKFKELKSLESSSSIHHKLSFNNNDFVNRMNIKRSGSVRVTCYSLADLLTATGNFATGRLLGEGSIGRVYRAKDADGKVLAVKKIDSSFFQGGQGADFTNIVTNISKLHHPNISQLVGYCSEQGHNMLVYEYFRNGSLHEFLHLTDDFSKPLTWNTRVRIALGTARAVEYLHEVCSPSCIHKNIKTSNILLDTELNPCLSECGLEIFHQSASQNLGNGYNAPECTEPSAFTLKSDVYSFGVVMLELLTGRMPFDSSKPRLEQSLVRWATPQLHDIDALEKMVDPALRGLYASKSVSRFADVIALCVQPEPEFRPPMSEVVQALVRLVQRSSLRLDSSASRRADDYD